HHALFHVLFVIIYILLPLPNCTPFPYPTLFRSRWAPSSYNEQPWRYIVASRKDSEEFARLLSCLVEGNQAWARSAPVLALGCVRSEEHTYELQSLTNLVCRLLLENKKATIDSSC